MKTSLCVLWHFVRIKTAKMPGKYYESTRTGEESVSMLYSDKFAFVLFVISLCDLRHFDLAVAFCNLDRARFAARMVHDPLAPARVPAHIVFNLRMGGLPSSASS
jgi:hypothetical protein